MSKDKVFTVQEFSELIRSFVKDYDQMKNEMALEQFMHNRLEISGVFESSAEITETVEKICSTIDDADKEMLSLRESKKNGQTTVSWFKNKIESIIKSFSDIDQSNIAQQIKEALKKANKELFSIIYEKDFSEEMSEPITSYDFKDINAIAIIQNLKKEIENNTFLGGIIGEDAFNITLDAEHKKNKTVQDYFNAKLDDPEDKAIKKVIAAAAEVTKRNGFKAFDGKSTEEVCLIVDRGLTSAKTAYKIGSGEMSIPDVTDYMIDKTVSSLCTIIKKECQMIGSKVGLAIGQSIGEVFGPAGAVTGSAIGKILGYEAGTAVGELLGKGAEKVASLCKKTASVAWDRAKTFGQKIINFLT